MNTSFINCRYVEEIWIYGDFSIGSGCSCSSRGALDGHLLGRDSDAPERAGKGCNTFHSSQTSTTSPATLLSITHITLPSLPPGGRRRVRRRRRAGWRVRAADQRCGPADPIHAEQPFIRLRMSRKTSPQARAVGCGAGGCAAWAAQAFGRWPVP